MHTFSSGNPTFQNGEVIFPFGDLKNMFWVHTFENGDPTFENGEVTFQNGDPISDVLLT